MNKKIIIIPILFLLAIAIIIDRIVIATQSNDISPGNLTGNEQEQPSDDSSDMPGTVRPDTDITTDSIPKYIFTDQDETFSFSFPRNLNVVGGDADLANLWRQNTEKQGNLLAMVIIPRSIEPKTNFSEAIFTVGSSADTTEVASCLKPLNGEVDMGTVNIKGKTFTKLSLGDAGAGNYYDTTSYRIVRNGQCYAIEHTIHSTSLAAYEPSQGIREFDRGRIVGMLEEIAASFSFLE
jgi:hypothetical protein